MPRGAASPVAAGGRNPLATMGPQGKAPRSSAKTGLGGEQVEGRQAVRELLLANRRDAREIWMAQDLDPAPVLEDIRELAAEARVVIKEVGPGQARRRRPHRRPAGRHRLRQAAPRG